MPTLAKQKTTSQKSDKLNSVLAKLPKQKISNKK